MLPYSFRALNESEYRHFAYCIYWLVFQRLKLNVPVVYDTGAVTVTVATMLDRYNGVVVFPSVQETARVLLCFERVGPGARFQEQLFQSLAQNRVVSCSWCCLY
jgi:hypothetical protein